MAARVDDWCAMALAAKISGLARFVKAAIAVHELKDRLGLDVQELRLVVAPMRDNAPGNYRVTCTIEALALPQSVSVQVVVRPEDAITPVPPTS